MKKFKQISFRREKKPFSKIPKYNLETLKNCKIKKSSQDALSHDGGFVSRLKRVAKWVEIKNEIVEIAKEKRLLKRVRKYLWWDAECEMILKNMQTF